MSDTNFRDDDGPLPSYPLSQRVVDGYETSWWQDVNNAVYRGALVLLSRFVGADPTGVADSTAAINAALSAAAVLKTGVYVDGTFRYTSVIVVPQFVGFYGAGVPSFEATPSRSRLLKDFNPSGVGDDVAGVLFKNDDTFSHGVTFDNVVGRTGDNAAIWGSRFNSEDFGSFNAGNDGVRLAKDELTPATINANLWRFARLQVLNNGRYGLYVSHQNTDVSAAYPLGAPDCNAGYIGLLIADRNGDSGCVLGNTIDNYIASGVCQSNGQYGFKWNPGAKNNIHGKLYCEANVTRDFYVDAASAQNMGPISRYATVDPRITNNGTDNNLFFTHYDNRAGGYLVSPWLMNGRILGETTGDALIGAFVTANAVGGWHRIAGDGVTGTAIYAVTRKTGIGELDSTKIDENGNFRVVRVGAGLCVAEGANAKQGVSAALVAGTTVVANTSVTANSRIFLTRQVGGANPGAPHVTAIVPGVSFTITSTNAADTGVVAYQIFEPA